MIHVLLTRTPLYSQDCSCFLVRLACVKRAASVDSEPGSNSRLNLLFWMARLLLLQESPDRSPQFELKLLTNISIYHHTEPVKAPCDDSHSTRLSNICASNPRFCKGELH